jgi:hypothetical protein
MGRDYTVNLVNSQVVPSYEDTSLAAVREYRKLMDKYQPMPPAELLRQEYKPLKYSFVSFEGFLNARLLVEALKRLGPQVDRSRLKAVVEGIKALDLGINDPVVFGLNKHQGLDRVYYTTVEAGRLTALKDWKKWEK